MPALPALFWLVIALQIIVIVALNIALYHLLTKHKGH
jgi:hypothetical protein